MPSCCALRRTIILIERVPMRILRALLFSLLFFFTAASVLADVPFSDPEAQTRFAEKAASVSLNFRQGDVASLVDARPLFTESGWEAFLKRLAGSMDPRGAATFTSTFTPSGSAIAATKDKDGVTVTVTVPGVLKHESRSPQGGVSSTAYRAEIDIRLAPGPLRIERLVQRTCGGATTKSSCR